MAVTTFQYITLVEFREILPNITLSSNKVAIRNWVTTGTTNLYDAHATGTFSMLYKNGAELTLVVDTPDANGEFQYVSGVDKMRVFDTGDNPNDVLMEGGEDWATYMDNQLEYASNELNSMLDSRFSTPIPKQFMNDNESTPDYDFIIKKLTAWIAGVNIMRAENPLSEEADKLESMHEELLRKLNAGDMRLRVEINSSDKNGEVIELTQVGGIYLVETYCEQWGGALYDLVNIKCTTSGVFGTCKIDVKMLGGNALKGSTVLTGTIVTGGLQLIGNGLYVRFEGGASAEMSTNDEWDVKIRRSDLDESNATAKDIPIHRGKAERVR